MIKIIRLTRNIIFLLAISQIGLYAQETTLPAGDEAYGSAGAVSYSVGQVVYSTNTGVSENSELQGVQQPYEISEVIGVSETVEIALTISVYPNPTTDYLSIVVESYSTDNLEYQITDISGKKIHNVKATGSETQIDVNQFTTGVYFVNIMENQVIIKVLKIIKQ